MIKRIHSIDWRLSCTFALVVICLMAGSFFALERSGDFDTKTTEARNQLLQKTRLIGDLNNFTSDFRAAEASRLLSQTAALGKLLSSELEQLDSDIRKTQSAYLRSSLDDAENNLYAEFDKDWEYYLKTAALVFQLLDGNKSDEATVQFNSVSRKAYDKANAALDKLTALTNARGRVAVKIANASLQQEKWLSRLAIVFGATIAVAGLVYVRRSITKPLVQLADSMQRLSMTETDVAIPSTDRLDEIGEMARAAVIFRANAIELLMNQSGLANQAAMLFEKLAHEKQLTEVQRNFVTMASHEFRTPLNIIDGQAQRLINLRDRITKDDIENRAKRIRFAVDRMSHLISRMLNAASILDGELNLFFHPERMNLTQVIQEVCATYREVAPAANIIECLEASAIFVTGDERLLFQALSNVIGNAIKYSPKGAPITVRTAASDNRCVITVEDKGIGIPDSDKIKIFEQFYRGSNVTGTVGTGIGLFLVRTVVELHHGRLIARNGLDCGSVFEITIPVSEIH